MPATMLQATGRHPLLPSLASRPPISSQSHFVVACTSTGGGGNPEQDNGIADSGAKGIDQHHELRKRVGWFEDKHKLGRSVGWFIDRASALPSLILSKGAARNVKGLWDVCDACGAMLYARSEGLGKRICHECGHHLRRGSSDRIEQLIDPGTWVPLDEDMIAVDVLRFRDEEDYSTRLSSSRKRSGLTDAVQTGLGEISGMPVALGVMDFRFMGGSMGSVVGEKITRLVEAATASRRPLIIICSSGGARMQEGALSLMQMAKVSAALDIHQAQEGLLYIPILTNPTTGGITASFGMLGDIIIAEPKAYIAFAGGRVIKQTLQLGSNLPQGFQVAEYVFEHGLLDLIVPGSLMKGCLKEIFALYEAAPCKRRSKAV